MSTEHTHKAVDQTAVTGHSNECRVEAVPPPMGPPGLPMDPTYAAGTQGQYGMGHTVFRNAPGYGHAASMGPQWNMGPFAMAAYPVPPMPPMGPRDHGYVQPGYPSIDVHPPPPPPPGLGQPVQGIPLMPQRTSSMRWVVEDPLAIRVTHGGECDCGICRAYLDHLPADNDPAFQRVHEDARAAQQEQYTRYVQELISREGGEERTQVERQTWSERQELERLAMALDDEQRRANRRGEEARERLSGLESEIRSLRARLADANRRREQAERREQEAQRRLKQRSRTHDRSSSPRRGRREPSVRENRVRSHDRGAGDEMTSQAGGQPTRWGPPSEEGWGSSTQAEFTEGWSVTYMDRMPPTGPRAERSGPTPTTTVSRGPVASGSGTARPASGLYNSDDESNDRVDSNEERRTRKRKDDRARLRQIWRDGKWPKAVSHDGQSTGQVSPAARDGEAGTSRATGGTARSSGWEVSAGVDVPRVPSGSIADLPDIRRWPTTSAAALADAWHAYTPVNAAQARELMRSAREQGGGALHRLRELLGQGDVRPELWLIPGMRTLKEEWWNNDRTRRSRAGRPRQPGSGPTPGCTAPVEQWVEFFAARRDHIPAYWERDATGEATRESIVGHLGLRRIVRPHTQWSGRPSPVETILRLFAVPGLYRAIISRLPTVATGSVSWTTLPTEEELLGMDIAELARAFAERGLTDDEIEAMTAAAARQRRFVGPTVSSEVHPVSGFADGPHTVEEGLAMVGLTVQSPPRANVVGAMDAKMHDASGQVEEGEVTGEPSGDGAAGARAVSGEGAQDGENDTDRDVSLGGDDSDGLLDD